MPRLSNTTHPGYIKSALKFMVLAVLHEYICARWTAFHASLLSFSFQHPFSIAEHINGFIVFLWTFSNYSDFTGLNLAPFPLLPPDLQLKKRKYFFIPFYQHGPPYNWQHIFLVHHWFPTSSPVLHIYELFHVPRTLQVLVTSYWCQLSTAPSGFQNLLKKQETGTQYSERSVAIH